MFVNNCKHKKDWNWFRIKKMVFKSFMAHTLDLGFTTTTVRIHCQGYTLVNDTHPSNGFHVQLGSQTFHGLH